MYFTTPILLTIFAFSVSVAQNPIQMGRNVPHRAISEAGSSVGDNSSGILLERAQGRKRLNDFARRVALPTITAPAQDPLATSDSSPQTSTVTITPTPAPDAPSPTSSSTTTSSGSDSTPTSSPTSTQSSTSISDYFHKESPYYVPAVTVCVAIAITISLLLISIAKWCAHRPRFANDKDYPGGFLSDGTPNRESFTGLKLGGRGMMRLGSQEYLDEKYRKPESHSPPASNLSPARSQISVPAPIFDPRPPAVKKISPLNPSYSTPIRPERSATPPRLAYSKSHSYLRPISNDSSDGSSKVKRSYTMKKPLSYTPTHSDLTKSQTKNISNSIPQLLPPLPLKDSHPSYHSNPADPFRNPSPQIRPFKPYSNVGPIGRSLPFTGSCQVGEVLVLPLREGRERTGKIGLKSSNTVRVSSAGAMRGVGGLKYSNSTSM